MKAYIFSEYGSPKNLKLTELPIPTLKKDEVLIKVKAVSINPLDWRILRGEPKIVRLSSGFFKSRNKQIGSDLAGIVEQTGENVTNFKVGDEVIAGIGQGAFAEFAKTKSSNLFFKPANMSFQEAAGIPVAAMTALQGLTKYGPLKPGMNVMINGASGGIGTYAVQIAKAWSCNVTAICSGRNIDLVRSIGADEVIDYTKEDFATLEPKFDLILDAVGNRNIEDYLNVLNNNGKTVVAGFKDWQLAKSILFKKRRLTRNTNKNIRMMNAEINESDMQILHDLIVDGKVKTIIDQCYSFDQLVEAVAYQETNRSKGKVIVELN